MSVTTAGMVATINELIPVAQKTHSQVQRFRERTPELEPKLQKITRQLDFILDCFKYIRDNSSILPAELEGISDEAVKMWEEQINETQKNIEKITSRSLITRLFSKSEDQKALAKICITLEQIVTHMNILITCNSLKIEKYIAVTTEEIKAMQQAHDQKFNETIGTQTFLESAQLLRQRAAKKAEDEQKILQATVKHVASYFDLSGMQTATDILITSDEPMVTHPDPVHIAPSKFSLSPQATQPHSFMSRPRSPSGDGLPLGR